MAKRRKPWIYEYVKVLSIVDGDTFNADIDMGGRQHSMSPIRLKGINTPELKSKDPEQQRLAHLAKDFLESIIPPGTMLKAESKRLDKNGRFESICYNEAGEVINTIVLNSGHAVKALKRNAKNNDTPK